MYRSIGLLTQFSAFTEGGVAVASGRKAQYCF
ncbi:MAG: hypothetical protein CM1200mP2_57990 [Planctomycetaceae bacterium]|nr:MAG: hypothetical protein CM1200mP2_57990 [Planctomycetaceae bacterium]